METYTISEAAALSGLSQKAIRNRVDRGQLRAVKRAGVRRIPRSELRRANLLRGSQEAHEQPPEPDVAELRISNEPLVGQLLDRLERQAEQLGEYRALSRRAESLQEERDLLEKAVQDARAEVLRAETRAAHAEAHRPRARAVAGERALTAARRVALVMGNQIGTRAERVRRRATVIPSNGRPAPPERTGETP